MMKAGAIDLQPCWYKDVTMNITDAVICKSFREPFAGTCVIIYTYGWEVIRCIVSFCFKDSFRYDMFFLGGGIRWISFNQCQRTFVGVHDSEILPLRIGVAGKAAARVFRPCRQGWDQTTSLISLNLWCEGVAVPRNPQGRMESYICIYCNICNDI